MRPWLIAAAAAVLAWPTTAQQPTALATPRTRTSARPQPTKALAAQRLLQDVPPPPPCADPCRLMALRVTKCSPRDPSCLCNDQDFAKALTECVTSRCTIKESLIKNTTSITCDRPIRNNTYGFVPLNVVFAVLASLSVVQRFAFKFWTRTAITVDDWVTLAALVFSLPSAVFNSTVLAPNGIGRDAWTVTFDQITTFIRFFSIMEIIYFLDIGIIKLALLFFYLRIFPSTTTRRLLIATIVFNSLMAVAFFFVAIFQCKPITYAWDKWDGEHKGQCLDINSMVKSHAIISIVLDVWMLAIPLWHLKNLKIDWKRKVGVALMFSVGTFVLRLQAINFGSHTSNPTRDFLEVALWSMIEINVGIICVCMPSLRLLLVRLFPRLRSSSMYARRKSRAPVGAYIRAVVASQRSNGSRQVVQDKEIHCEKTFSVEHAGLDDDDDEQRLVKPAAVPSAGNKTPKFF